MGGMPLAPGTRLGLYEIVAPLGAGGMGEVYRAHDARLRRDAALKVLPPRLAGDAQAMERFRREAQTLAGLSHAHIAAVYGFDDGALAMDLVEGPTLAERIGRGRLGWDEALPLARQLAEAIEYAHERGIVHRDLKPANIKLTGEEQVKVLDFGLAKALAGDSGGLEGAALADSPTLSRAATQAGLILGTAAYMAPEQAKGKSVDRRADIWAFGCVLYEMLTGAAAFQGETITDILAAVVMREPDWGRLPAGTPAGVRGLLERCLTKDPRQRLQAMGEARIALERDFAAGTGAAAAAPARRLWQPGWLAAAVLGLVAVGLGYRVALAPPRGPGRPTFSYIPPPPGTVFKASGFNPGPAVISPDGTKMAFSATDSKGTTRLWERDLSSEHAVALAGTEGASEPFWSPDGRSLGFLADHKLKTVALDHGDVQALGTASSDEGYGGAWGPDGRIVYPPSDDGVLWAIAAAGGSPERLALGAAGGFYQEPSFLPDGRLLYAVSSRRDTVTAVWLASLGGGKPRKLVDNASSPEYASGHLLFLREGRVWAQAFDPGRATVSGAPAPLATAHSFSVAATGALVMQRGASVARLAWFDRSGNPLGTVGPEAQYRNAAISPDGTRVLATVDTGTAINLWSYPAGGGVGMPLTFGPGSRTWAVWSPDGKSVAYSCQRGQVWGLCRRPADGSGTSTVLARLPSFTQITAVSWSPDGRYLSFDGVPRDSGNVYGNWVLPLGAGPSAPARPWLKQRQAGAARVPQTGEPKPWRAAPVPANQFDGDFSPDGHWLAYFSYDTGRSEVYVVPFPGPGGKFQISQNGGWAARWDRQGHLYFLDLSNRIVEADLALTREAVRVTALHPLFAVSLPQAAAPYFDVSADGSRFLVVTPSDPTLAQYVTVLQNWQGR